MSNVSLKVDWDNDGDYDDAGEDVTADVLSATGITSGRGRDQAIALNPPMAGVLQARLNNRSRDYSPENGSSPLDGMLYPGHRVQLTSAEGSPVNYNAPIGYNEIGTYYNGMATIPIATTVLNDLPQNARQSLRTVDVRALGMFSKLVGKRVSTPLFQDITIDAAIEHILDAVGWPSGEREISNASTTLDWWWLDDEDAWTALQVLVASEGPGACAYEDPRGYFIFEGGSYRFSQLRSTTSQVTLAANGTPPVMADLIYRPPLRNVINSVSVDYKIRAAQSLAVVWSLGSGFTLGGNQSRSFIARSSSGDPFKNVAIPTFSTDYTVLSGSIVAVGLDRTSGGNVTVTLTAGASGCTLGGLQLRAQRVATTHSGRITNQLDMSVSIAKFGLRPFTYTTRAEIDIDILQSFADATVSLYGEPRAQLDVVLINTSAANAFHQLNRRISDRITIVDPETGMNADVWIENIQHTITRDSRIVTVFGCEKALDIAYGIWDESDWDGSVWGY